MRAFLPIFLVFLIFLMVFSSLCINRAPAKTLTSPHSESPAQEIMRLLNEARENLDKCSTTLKEPLAPGSKPEYLNMTVLNETTANVGGKRYRYAVLGIWNVSFSGNVSLGGYRILWGQPGNVTTTGGQEIDFKIYKNSDPIASFTHWYIPFQLDSYCVSIRSRPVKLPDGDEMTFIFIHTEGKDLWLVLLG